MDKVLLVEDDPGTQETLVRLVESIGCVVLEARDARGAILLLRREEPELAIVGLAIRQGTALALISEMRSRTETPIIVLSFRGSEDDKVKCLEAGADDYVVKPFGHGELVARMRVQLRHSKRTCQHAGDGILLRTGPLTLNVAEHAAKKQGRSLNLTPTEFRLLHYLMNHASRVIPAAALLKEVWGYDDPSARDVLRVTLYRLRQKLEDDPSEPQLLRTVPGVGVMLKPGEATESAAS